MRSPLEGLTGSKDSVSWLEPETPFYLWSSCRRSLCTCKEFNKSQKSRPLLSNGTMYKLLEAFVTHRVHGCGLLLLLPSWTESISDHLCCRSLSGIVCTVDTVDHIGRPPHVSLTGWYPVMACTFIQVLSFDFALLMHSHPAMCMYLCIMYVFYVSIRANVWKSMYICAPAIGDLRLTLSVFLIFLLWDRISHWMWNLLISYYWLAYKA